MEAEYDKAMALTARMSAKTAETMFEPDDEVLKLEQFMSGCTAAETKVAALDKFEFESNVVVNNNLLCTQCNYDRYSDVTILSSHLELSLFSRVVDFKVSRASPNKIESPNVQS
jgi:hypothetical protein